MNNLELNKLLGEENILVSDGATGTNLIARGLGRGETAEHWVLNKPQEILKLHQDFIAAGSDIILTSTFGGSEIRLKHAGLHDQFTAVNASAVKIAREAAAGTTTLVAGSLGPLGEMLKPLGLLEITDAKRYYSDQAKVLVDSGVDLLIVETQFDINEAQAAIEGIRSVSEIGLICSFSFDRGTKTMMGVSPEKFANAVSAYDLSALGINCGKSLSDNLQCLSQLFDVTDLPIWFKPNAGLPQLDAEGHAIYSLSPEEMGDSAKDWPAKGAKIIGGCCGTSPEHLQKIAESFR